ncbi:hypothetical protein [Streptomyces alboflavus]|uniref:hypothetical protein n=1 Tax=Streptomyces alboflavus TaxID=67267 RepID=UPI0036BAF433
MEQNPPQEARSDGVSVSYEADGTRVVSRLLPANESGVRHELVHRFADAIEHLYAPRPMNEDVPLFAGKLKFTHEPNAVYDARVTYRWSPRPRVEAEGTRPAGSGDIAALMDSAQSAGMWRTLSGVLIDLEDGIIPLPAGRAALPDADVATEQAVDQELGDGSQLDEITCVVPNLWPTVRGTGICDPGDLGHTWYGRTTAEGDGWRVEFDRTRSAPRAVFKQLQRRGGRLFTHTARLTRIDGSPFSSVEALDALDRIRLGLGLALGRRTGCVLPVGFFGGKPVWTLWRGQRVDRYRSTSSQWLDETTDSVQLSEIVGKTLDATQDATARGALSQAIGYYIAGLGDVDVELQANMAVSGMQLLSHYRFVTTGLYTSKQWDDLKPCQGPTEWEIRQLLSGIGINTPVPAHFAHLYAVQQRLAAKGARFDGLGTVVKMRNVATHPTKDQPASYSTQEWTEAGLLGCYWFGLSLLDFIHYNGKIAAILQPRPRYDGELRAGPWSAMGQAGAWQAGDPADV